MQDAPPDKVLATNRKPSPLRVAAILLASVFAIELGLMFLFSHLTPIPSWEKNLLDASVLVALLFPILYYSIYRPLASLIDQHVLMEKELLEHRNHLEGLVNRRTMEVERHMKEREEEDALAAYVMGRYLDSSHKDPRVEFSILSASHHFSGDAISVARTPDGGLTVMMLDAMGHGLAAAISVLPAIQLFYAMSKKGLPLETLIPELNDKIHELSPPGHFLSGTLLHLNPESSQITGWIGGTPKVYLHFAGDIQMFGSSNLPLGIRPSAKLDFHYFNAPWHSHSMLLTCTDGVLEAKGTDGRELGEAWLRSVIEEYGHALDEALFRRVWEESMGGNKPNDDASVLIISQVLGLIQ